MGRPATVIIDKFAFVHNLQRVKAYAPNKTIVAVVKANAYGHGIGPLVPALANTKVMGVSCIEEALEIRQHRLQQPILLMEGFFEAKELATINELNFQIVVHNEQQLRTLEQCPIKFNKPLVVWLKLDTGMHRLGFHPEKITSLLARLNAIEFLQQPINFMTHFADADEPANPKNQQQCDYFFKYTKDLPGLTSLANSGAIIAFPEAHGDWIRPGIMLYGISPFADKTGLEFNLQPVMTLTSKIIAIRQLQTGDSIGYGSIWVCPEPMLVGVVAMGYGDGYPRHAVAGTPVLVNNKEVPLVGRISMDMLTVDLRTQPQAQVGDPVVLWGRGLPIEKVAACADTIAYELVCNVNKRVHRILG